MLRQAGRVCFCAYIYEHDASLNLRPNKKQFASYRFEGKNDQQMISAYAFLLKEIKDSLLWAKAIVFYIDHRSDSLINRKLHIRQFWRTSTLISAHSYQQINLPSTCRPHGHVLENAGLGDCGILAGRLPPPPSTSRHYAAKCFVCDPDTGGLACQLPKSS